MSTEPGKDLCVCVCVLLLAMSKSQLQDLAQQGSFGLPSYACVRQGPDHAPLFKAAVTFNGERFESKGFFSTLRQAEHAAAEVALRSLSERGPVALLASRILDDTGYKNLLQETAHRAGIKGPVYKTVTSGPAHLCQFTSTVEIAGMSFTGKPSKTKKQAEKNSALAAWSALKKLVIQNSTALESSVSESNEQEQNMIVRALTKAYKDDENKCVTYASESMQMHQTCNSHVQQGARSSTFPKITIVPFQKPSAQTGDSQQTLYYSSPRVSVEANDEYVCKHNFVCSHHRSGITTGAPPCQIGFPPHLDHVATSGLVKDMQDAVPVSIASAGSSGSMARPIVTHLNDIPSASQRDVHMRGEKNRCNVEITTSGDGLESCEKDVEERALPIQSSVNHMIWPPSAHWLGTDAQVKDASVIHNPDAASSLGLTVCIKPDVAAYSTPPRQSEPDNGDDESKYETVTGEILSRLKLEL